MSSPSYNADHDSARAQRFHFPNRLERADDIVAKGEIVKSGNAWLVPSQSSDAVYRVTMGEHGPECTCPDFKARRNFCKHQIAASKVAQAQAAK